MTTPRASEPTFFRGEWFEAGQPGYEAALPIFNQRSEGRPQVVARCAGVADVVAAIAHARRVGVRVDVRSGGYNIGTTSNDGVVIDLSAMRGIQLRPEQRVARIEGGVRGGDIQIEAALHGLGAVTGALSGSGVGLMLSGGVGYLTPRAGWASDNVLAFEMVTAAGEVVRASPDENPDLFWAVRGSTGSLGVVTALEVRLLEVPPVVHASLLNWSFEELAHGIEALRSTWDWAPDELALISIMTAPSSAGPGGLEVFACHSGAPDAARADLERLRSFGAPSGGIDALPFRDLHFVNDELFVPARAMTDEAPVADLGDDLLSALVAKLREPGAGSEARSIEIFARRGALGRPPEHPSVLREGPESPTWSLAPSCFWEDPAEDGLHERWIVETCAEIRRIGPASENFHPNVIGRTLDAERVAELYGDRFGRLRDLKRHWDPGNLFRGNQDIPLAGD